MEDIKRFFLGTNTITSLSDAEHAQRHNYLDTLRAVSRITYSSMYVIDYQRREFEYVSDNPLFLCSHTPDEVRELGYAFYFRYVAAEDLEMLIRVNEIGFSFFDRTAIDDRKKYSISYDFNLMDGRDRILVNHKLTPIFMTCEGKIWKALCLVSLSTNSASGNIVLSKEGDDAFWELDLAAAEWHKMQKIKLTEREMKTLRFYAQGLSINQIAERMCVSADTVKFHRRKLFGKLHVKNISEDLAYATNNKLF